MATYTTLADANTANATDAEKLAAAWTQFDNNLRYWESATIAGNLAEACGYLLRQDPQSLSVAGRTYTRESLERMRDEAVAKAETGRTGRPALFSRARVQGLGR